MPVSALVFTRSAYGAAISHWPRLRRRWRSTRTVFVGASRWGWGRRRFVRCGSTRRAACSRERAPRRRMCARWSALRSPISSRYRTCTPRPSIAGALPSPSPCAPSPMRTAPPQAPMRVDLTVNGATHALEVEPRMSLLDCLRERLLLAGAHAGCEHGVCGACTVLLDGAPVRSCLMFAVQADGYDITTIEGLAPGPGEL